MNSIFTRNATELLEKVDLANSGLLLVDIQNDYCHEDGAYPKIGLNMTVFRELAVRVDSFLARVRQAGIPIIHIGQLYTAWTMSAPYLQRLKQFNIDPYNTLRPGSWGAGFYKITPQDGECVVMKYRDSGFFGTDLDQILRCSKVNTIILTGMATSGCVESTARDGFFRDYYIVTLEDLTADGLKKIHGDALGRLASIGPVTSSQVLLEAWASLGKKTG